MKRYVGVKEVLAELMALGEYNEMRGTELGEGEKAETEGYLVTYSEDYSSWCPRDIFEKNSKPSKHSDGVWITLKELQGKPMKRGAYVTSRGWKLPDDQNPEDDGYMVIYDNGYVSWSPKDEFEATYRVTVWQENDAPRTLDNFVTRHAIFTQAATLVLEDSIAKLRDKKSPTLPKEEIAILDANIELDSDALDRVTNGKPLMAEHVGAIDTLMYNYEPKDARERMKILDTFCYLAKMSERHGVVSIHLA